MSETTYREKKRNNYDMTNVGSDYNQVEVNSDEEFSKYMLDRMKQLEARNNFLREQCDQIKSEKRFVENQKLKYEREIRKMQSEIDRLKTAPLIIGTILDVVNHDKVLIRSTTGPQFMVNVSQYIDDDALVVGAKVALNQHTLAVVEVIPPTEELMVSAMEIVESPEVDYDQIGGLDEQIQELVESVELPLTKPETFKRIGITPPKGILLHGPPGTGKTMLAKAVANRTDATFIRVVGSELVQKYIGDGAKLVRDIFEMARKKAPSIIFIDELDAIATIRMNETSGADREVQRTLMQLLAEMDGFDSRGDVRIIAATNRPDSLDPAILRPGRFDRVVKVPMPNIEAREHIIKIHVENMTISDDIDFRRLAKLTEGSSGADLKAIATEAGMLAVRADKRSVEMNDFLDAVEKVLKSIHPPAGTHPEAMFV
ncbi:MAG: proteasome-activating nucleotidase [Methanosarcinaceae archaeon]|nr:proteasome-activating nucleotidase [Methanosarcinaceae archaeon]